MLWYMILLTRNKYLQGLKEMMLIMPALYCFHEMIGSPIGLPSLHLETHSCHLISPTKGNIKPAASDNARLLASCNAVVVLNTLLNTSK
ncbi:unnamed protein product [Urochloa decumbens]|uniref:Uncharacterized protein n=1 Tax=Urochloa decumbens TaxID=240449 RepID=A0ABC8WCV1_9POAL